MQSAVAVAEEEQAATVVDLEQAVDLAGGGEPVAARGRLQNHR